MLPLVSRNLGLKILSVALAVTAWAYFHLAAAPGTTARFTQQVTVPIILTGVRPGFVATFTGDKTAIVTFDVPRSGAPVRTDQIQAVVDVNDRIDPGPVNLPVRLVAPDVVVRSLSPASITVTLDRLEEHAMPIAVSYSGDRPKSVVVESAEVAPSTTTLRGVSGNLAKVTAVRIDIPFQDRPGVFDAMVRPIAADARGVEVAGVAVSPTLVRVRARFVRSAGH